MQTLFRSAKKASPRRDQRLNPPPDTDRERRRARARKFLSYYRPHLKLLALDIVCALLVAGAAVALPLCVNLVVGRLLALPDTPQAFGQILIVGGVMLAILAMQAIAMFFV